MRIINDIKLDFCDVLIQPKRSRAVSRADVDLNRKFKFLNSTSVWNVFPLISANMAATGTMNMAHALKKHGAITALHKHYSIEELVSFYNTHPDLTSQNVFYTLGIQDEDFVKLETVQSKLNYEISAYCIDTPNGYTDVFVNTIKRLRKLVGSMPVIMAGNVVSGDMCQEILFAGADIVKIGLGSGKFCKTREITGIGFPMLSSCIDCLDCAHGITSSSGHGLICADGGCREPGDVVKAFAVSDFCMVGGLLCGTDENEGEWTYWDHKPKQKKALKCFGMSSREANDLYNGGLKDYRAAEGRCEYIPYKGPVDRVMQEIMGGIRSACTYVGTNKLKDLSKCTNFIKVNRTYI